MEKSLRKILLIFFWAMLLQTARSQSFIGKDFWFAFPSNNSNLTAQYTLIINSTYCAKVVITYPLLNYKDSCMIQGNSCKLNIPQPLPAGVFPYITGAGISNLGFHITSDSAITVQAIVYEQATVDAENLIPTNQLGTNYVVTARQYSDVGSQTANFSIGATENNTVFTVRNRVSGATVTQTLNAGQVFTVVGTTVANCNADIAGSTLCRTLTGSTVTATKPVYVFSHTRCSRMTNCGACDVMMSEFFPVNLLNNTYVTAEPIARGPNTCPINASMASFLEIAGPAGTTVTVNNWSGNTTLTIPASPFTGYHYVMYRNPLRPTPAGNFEFNGEANTVITASNPVQVVQYQRELYTDNTPNTDPEATTLAPVSMWASQYIFSTAAFPTSPQTDICVITDLPNTGNIIIDPHISGGTNLSIFPGGWNQIGTSNYYYKRITGLASGAGGVPIIHTLQSTNNSVFGFYTIAKGPAESYITVGGGSPIRYPFVSSCPTVTVPLGLLSFSGTLAKDEVQLSWTVASGSSPGYFIVERASDGSSFVPVGKVRAEEGAESRVYTFTEPSVKGKAYYRLRLEGQDNTVDFSNVVSISNIPEERFDIIGMSRPTSGRVEVSFGNDAPCEVLYYVTSLMGARVMEPRTVSAGPGLNMISLDTSLLPEGLYFLVIEKLNGQRIQARLVR
jgi:hypothetical protein